MVLMVMGRMIAAFERSAVSQVSARRTGAGADILISPEP